MPITIKVETYTFDFVNDTLMRYYLLDAFSAVSKAEAWEFLKNYEPKEGFMFSKHPMLTEINKYIDTGHSGASYGMTMREIHYVAKFGYEEYKNNYLENSKPKKSIEITI
jgi:hypothetical protein